MLLRLRRYARILLPMGALLALFGYLGPWVGHKAAGLVILGLDLGEYVKFLPAVRSGEVWLWREGFYVPLICVSLAASLYAFREEYRYGWGWRAALLGIGGVAALNMLPPAWTPTLLLDTEFRLQTLLMAGCLVALLFSPLLALTPRTAAAAVVTAIAAAATVLTVAGFLSVLPNIEWLYNNAIVPGWGMWIMVAGLAAMVVAVWMAEGSEQ